MNRILLITAVYFLFIKNGADQPDARDTGNLIYSPRTKSMLLLDGYTNHPDDGQNNVFGWNGKKWQKINASGPATKSLSTAALNTKTNSVIVFGGIGSKGYESLFGDTWEFTGMEWKRVPTNDIGTRDHCKMVYAANLDAMLMYGGINGNRKTDSSTWILKDGVWSDMKIDGPGTRFHFGMVYDPLRRKIVLYGGYNNKGLQQDTWEFDGTAWKKITTDGPGPRGRFSMTYDRSRKMAILFGGDVWKKHVDTSISRDGELWDIRNDTWGWDGNRWTQLSDTGPHRMLPAFGYDELRHKLVLFGGDDAFEVSYADTWEFEKNKWIKVADNGAWKWNGKKYEKLEGKQAERIAGR